MKKLIGVLMVLAAVAIAVTMTGCGFVAPSVRPAEMNQREYVAGGYRAGAEIVVANQFQATNVDVYLYEGAYRPKEEVLLNVNGKNVVLKEYVDHFWVMNAPSSQHPAVEKRLLDVNKCYTALRIVHGGVAGDYMVDTFSFCTTTDATRQSWRDGFGRPYYANVVMLLPGTDTPALQTFNPIVNIYPNNAVRQFLQWLGSAPSGR